MQRDEYGLYAHCPHSLKQIVGEVQAGGGRGCAALLAGIDGLVALGVS